VVHIPVLFLFITLFLTHSCTIYEKNFDNPIDYQANEEQGIGAPTLVFYPKTQTVSQSDAILLGSYIVFQEDSIEPFAGLQLQIQFPSELMQLDTVLPGFFITDTNQSAPLFTYSNEDNIIDIYAYFLDTIKLDLLGTGHLADLIFSPLNGGTDSIFYKEDDCMMIDHQEAEIGISGIRGAEIIIQ
tara:strand:+ start:579 stop:1136 length:558 start_codon:yes stop_codon:yes gene_type:complete